MAIPDEAIAVERNFLSKLWQTSDAEEFSIGEGGYWKEM